MKINNKKGIAQFIIILLIILIIIVIGIYVNIQKNTTLLRWNILKSQYKHFVCQSTYQECNNQILIREKLGELTDCHSKLKNNILNRLECNCESLTKKDGNPTNFEWCSFYN